MPTHEPDAPFSPFPRLPGALRQRFADGALSLRPFGLDAHDLEINFKQAARPLLVTQILTRCARDAAGRELDADFLWGLPVGTRIECLLAIATSGGRSAAVVPLRCAEEACAQEVEVELTLDEISALQERHGGEERFRVRHADEELWVRRPTGSDQLKWLERRFADASEAAAAMAATLMLDESPAPTLDESPAPARAARLDEIWAEALDEALDEFDPLVNFSLLVRCPDCGAEAEYEVDLEEFALGSLWLAQRQMLAAVHRLASHYHWDERQIFSVPHWRRAHYLTLIEREDRR